MSIDKKRQLVKEKIIAEHGGDPHNPEVAKALWLVDLMYESNIPVGYWFIRMKEFHGSPRLKEVVDNYMSNIHDMYVNGSSICLVGNQGTGKTMSSICILKSALKRNFTAYYTTASDIMTEMTNYNKSTHIRETLRGADFLVIDELDSRFFPSDAQKELFSGIYESIFRYRAHNTLPTIICTNETDDILNVFHGAGVQSITSLNDQYLTIYPVAGVDYRKRIKNDNVTG